MIHLQFQEMLLLMQRVLIIAELSMLLIFLILQQQLILIIAAINVTNIFDITAAADFTNAGTISANSFNAIVDSFINQSGARITAGECNFVATSSTDNGTITCLNSEGDAEVVDIATPFNGLSRNDYTDFNIPINGVVFNNSDSDATSQLLGDISKNPNINSGNTASIILAQVSDTNSLLFGALEVVWG